MNKNRKIVILDGYTENPGDLSWEPLEKFGRLTVYDRTPAAETVNRIGDAEIIFTNKTVISREILDACPNVKYIGVLATGFNVVDLNATFEKGITVTNIPSYGTDTVGQFAIALLLEICHHIGDHNRTVHEGKWEKCEDFCYWDYPLIELAGKTMGIVGFGRIGQATGRIAKALQMRVIAYDAYPNDSSCELADYVSLDQLFAESDVVSLHCPLTKDNEKMINRETIAKMKDGVIIINNSRGPLIDEAALAEALKEGKVYAAGLDVVSTEPIRGDNPLLKARNCFITPHISWAARESRQRLLDIAVDNLENYLAGTPVNVIGGKRRNLQ
ncbi:MAG: D-2-hydroxyacid dehydrogenase [Clostridiales bacterium]|nr:D-2-hydroxyacid dehydrogenase [Clostridiales bacterium]